ncbi:hypothetical protein R5R35_006817 [Gryllus longicercus]|uniref:Uncharacterized protein n=1 Tax=Gryllus longicercus TaxID=2509291 RepID=A0AAN9Z3P1_9ORTH
MMSDCAAALRLALLVAGSMLLHDCVCAAVPMGGSAAAAAAAAAAEPRPVWQWPCGEKSPTRPGTVLVPGEPVRHPAPKAMRRVHNQLAVSLQHMKKSQPALRQLYGNFSKLGELKYDWLPRKQLVWFKKHYQCSSNKIAEVLPVFHKSLQNFSVTFEAMKPHGESQIGRKDEIYRIRDPLLANITMWHKMLLCETEAAIHNVRLPAPEWVSVGILTKHWPPNPDLTETLVRDWGVIRQYELFLSEWARIIRLMGRKETPACKSGGAGGRAKPRRKQKQHAPP